MKSPLGTCLLIRYTLALLKEETDAGNARAAYEFLESCLRHKSEMVIYEAAKSICELPGVIAKYASCPVVWVAIASVRGVALSLALPCPALARLSLRYRDLSPAITVLHMFLSSPKPTLRYSAVKVLSKVAMVHPQAVSKCNDDMEALTSDANRTIATLAITTLLKTGVHVAAVSPSPSVFACLCSCHERRRRRSAVGARQ
jgi:coatomer protein complex subunit gamma